MTVLTETSHTSVVQNSKRKQRSPLSLANTVRLAFLFASSAFVLIPFYATVMGGFKTTGELRTQPFALPEHWDLTYYKQILSDPTLWTMLGNSLVYSGLTIIFTMLIASMVAFTFSHIHFFGKKYAYSYLIT
ncbi:MAG: carbohydrate ABC transporter permease, partial [Reinekea sp.]|nr:carbohydrate ABC transporter permease [Reinekea sp.]